MDINILPLSGIDATLKITSFSPAKVIGLSMHSDTGFAKNMIRAGAKGYVTKNSSKDEIFMAITEVAKGHKYICSEIKNMISEQVIHDNGDAPQLSSLTGREVQIIKFIREGFSSKEIAAAISVAVKTVEVHRHNILKKLKLRNSNSLVNFVYSNAGYFL